MEQVSSRGLVHNAMTFLVAQNVILLMRMLQCMSKQIVLSMVKPAQRLEFGFQFMHLGSLLSINHADLGQRAESPGFARR